MPQPESPPIRRVLSPAARREQQVASPLISTPPAASTLSSGSGGGSRLSGHHYSNQWHYESPAGKPATAGSPAYRGSVTPTSRPVTPGSAPRPDSARSPWLDSGGSVSTIASPTPRSAKLERKLTPDMLLSPVAPLLSPAAPLLSPLPVSIDMPSPSFDPILEHFLRPLDENTMCACLLERAARGKAFRMLVEDGNVLLLVAERRYRDFEIAASDGSRVATLHRSRHGHFVLRRATSAGSAHPELAAMILGEQEVSDAPSRPRLNHMRLAAGRWHATPLGALAPPPQAECCSGGGGKGGGSGELSVAMGGLGLSLSSSSASGAAAAAPPAADSRDPAAMVAAALASGIGGGPLYSRALGRPAGELLAALSEEAPPPSPSLMLLESRLPTWDESAQLLTLDFPPGRASLASVQNFQLVPPAVVEGAAAGAPASEDSLAYSAALVHGLIGEAAGTDTFSLDVRPPLSPLLAFAACLAAQDWE